MRGLKWIWVGWWALCACSSKAAPAGDDCIPGRQLACACPGGKEGVQICDDDRTFANCQCADDTPDTTTAVGAGGSAEATTGTGASAAIGSGGTRATTAGKGGSAGGTGAATATGSADINAATSSSSADSSAGGSTTTGDTTTGDTTSVSSTSGGVPPDGTFEAACPGIIDELGCTGTTAVRANTAHVLVVLDKSGSMAQTSNNVEKWAAMKSALSTALSSAQHAIDFGLELFPTPQLETDIIDRTECGQQGNCCEMPTHADMNVPVASGANAVNAILETLAATEPGGGTPTARALERAFEYFNTGAGAALAGPRYVLLATDGGPNCNANLSCGVDLCTYNLDNPTRDCSAQSTDNNCCNGFGEGCVDSANVVAQLENLAGAGIGTFVVGIPGSETYSDFLEDFAIAGGHAVDDSYYRVDDVAELGNVFQTITASLSCDLTLPTATSVAPRLFVDCREIPMSEAGANNWEWQSGSDQITLTGACELVQSGASRVDVLLDCPSQ